MATFGRIVADWSPEDVVALTDLLTRFNDSFHGIRASLLEEMASDPRHDSHHPDSLHNQETSTS